MTRIVGIACPAFDQMAVKLDTRYCRHVNIGDQAGGGSEFWGCQEFGGGREDRNGVAQRLEQPSHGVAKGLVVIDNRDQWLLRQCGLQLVIRSRNTSPESAVVHRFWPQE